MSGIDPSIPLGIKVPDTMHTLGSILDIQAKRQAIDTGAIQQQRAGVQLQQEQGALDAQRKVAAVVSDPAFRNPATGEWDLNRAAAAIVQADPMDYHATKAISAMAKANSDVMAVKKNSIGLADTSRAFVGSTLGALSGNPNVTKADAMAALDVAEQQAPDAKPSIDVWRRHLKNVPDDPRVLSGYFNIARNQAMPPATQVGAMTPSGPQVSTGTESRVVNTNPGAGAVGATIPGTAATQQVPPTQQETPGTDAMGNPIVVGKSPSGVITPKPMPGSSTPPMMSYPPGESQHTRAMLEQERQAALTTLSGAPVMHLTNRGVMEEIDKATTGTLGPKMASVMSAAGVSLPHGWGGASAEEKASAYDLVGKYLERNAITAAQSMGPHTNAGLEAQIKAQGSVAYNPTAIKKITQLNDALVTGSEHYQPGLEKAVTSSPDQIFAKRKFDQQWAQNFDPRVMMLFNAKTNGNQGEVNELVRSWGGKDSIVTKEILRKAKNLDMLSSEGHL